MRTHQDLDFCDYLAECGLLDKAEAAALRSELPEQSELLGQILIHEELLTLTQLMVLLDRQASLPGSRLGELAVREGMLSEEQLRRALDRQANTVPHAAEALLRRELVPRDRLLEALIGYTKRLESMR